MTATYNHIHKINKTTSQKKDRFSCSCSIQKDTERFQNFLLNYQLRDLRLELIIPNALLTTYYLKLTFQFLNVSAYHLTQFLRKSLGQK